MPCAGKFYHHLVQVYVAPAAGQSYAFGLNVAGSNKLNIPITNPSLSGANLTGEAAVTAGQAIYYYAIGSATSGASYFRSAMLFQPTTHGQIPFLSGLSSSGTEYMGINGHQASGTESRAHCYCPIPGKFKSLYLLSDDGAVAADVTVCLRKNGASSALTATIATGGTSANDLAHEVSVVAGDYVNLMGVSTTTEYLGIGLVFEPTNPKLWWLPGLKSRVSLSGTSYDYPHSSLIHQLTWDWQNTEFTAGGADRRVLWPAGLKVNGLGFGLTAAPGAGKVPDGDG